MTQEEKREVKELTNKIRSVGLETWLYDRYVEELIRLIEKIANRS